MYEKIFGEIKDLLVSLYEINGNSVKNDSRLYGREIGLSSLEMVNLVVVIEEKFNIEFPDEFFNRDLIVGDLVQWIMEEQ